MLDTWMLSQPGTVSALLWLLRLSVITYMSPVGLALELVYLETR